MTYTQPPHILVGKTITAVHLATDGGAIRFDIKDDNPIIARADGDCCSHSWIEEVDSPERLIGQTVLSADDLDGVEEKPYNAADYECLAFYGFKITTALGDVVLDYRNESNGYYGGSLCWGDDSFYGGVHGQNVSKEQWRRLA